MEHDHLFGRFAYMKNDIPVAGCAHQAGTCRFGTDPETSVLDVDCKAHELDNLYVVDTSIFPSIGAVNPALTAMANSLRVGDHLLDRLGATAPGWPQRQQRDRGRCGSRRARRRDRHRSRRAACLRRRLGGGLRSYEVAGRPLLDGFPAGDRPTSGRGQVLAPWPNRIEDGSYEFDGPTAAAAAHRAGARERDPRARSQRGWNVVDLAADRVLLDFVLEPQPGYPFTLGLSVEYALSDSGLTVHTTARNLGAEPCPYGSGQHPYLSLGTPTVDGLRLAVPADVVLISDERGLPARSESVDGTEYDFRAGRTIGGTVLDNGYSGLERDADGRARVRLDDPDTDAG